MNRIFLLLIVSSSLLYSNKKALIFGVAGQDGFYLSEFLLQKDYEVHGVKKPYSIMSQPIDAPLFFLHDGDVTDFVAVCQLIERIQPDEIYNLASQSQVSKSFEFPISTAETNALGSLHILESIRSLDKDKKMRYYQASTSELFGIPKENPQTEKTPFHPRSPYGIAKLYAHWITINYREGYHLFACNGILFNHESPLRKETFVTKKIIQAACRYKQDTQNILYLGNLDIERDWGYAQDYVESMWLMLQQETPDDFIIATGQLNSLRKFVELAYKEVGTTIFWEGSGLNERGIDQNTGKAIIKVDPKFYRPTEVSLTWGNPIKANTILQWKAKTSLEELIKIMIEAELQPSFR